LALKLESDMLLPEEKMEDLMNSVFDRLIIDIEAQEEQMRKGQIEEKNREKRLVEEA
jgi:hypothetical protein